MIRSRAAFPLLATTCMLLGPSKLGTAQPTVGQLFQADGVWIVSGDSFVSKTRIYQNGNRFRAVLEKNKSRCPNGGSRPFYLAGVIEDRKIYGSMWRCTKDPILVRDCCNGVDAWKVTFEGWIEDSNTIVLSYKHPHYKYDPEGEGEGKRYTNCRIDRHDPGEVRLSRARIHSNLPDEHHLQGSSPVDKGDFPAPTPVPETASDIAKWRQSIR